MWLRGARSGGTPPSGSGRMAFSATLGSMSTRSSSKISREMRLSGPGDMHRLMSDFGAPLPAADEKGQDAVCEGRPPRHSPNIACSNSSALRGALVYFPVATEKESPILPDRLLIPAMKAAVRSVNVAQPIGKNDSSLDQHGVGTSHARNDTGKPSRLSRQIRSMVLLWIFPSQTSRHSRGIACDGAIPFRLAGYHDRKA